MNLEIIHEVPEQYICCYPIVFVHGGYMGAWCWKPYFIPYFKSKGFECYAFSMRGHGNSEGFDRIKKHSFYDYVADLEQVVDGIGKKCILIGHSMGGAVVQKYCEQHGDKVAAMILLSSPAPNGMGLATGIELMGRGMGNVWSVTMFHQGIIKKEDYPEKFPFRWFFSDYMDQDEKLKYARMMKRESDKASKQITKRYVKEPSQLTMPKLVIGGEDDWYFAPSTQQATAALYNVNAVIVPKIAHNVMVDKFWKDVADEIHKFLLNLL